MLYRASGPHLETNSSIERGVEALPPPLHSYSNDYDALVAFLMLKRTMKVFCHQVDPADLP